METIWNLMNFIVVMFEIMGLGIIVISLFVGLGCNGNINNRILQKGYDLIVGSMFEDETLD